MKCGNIQSVVPFEAKPSKKREPLYVGPAIVAGVSAGAIGTVAPIPASLGIMGWMQKIEKLPEQAVKTIHAALDKALVDTGLKGKTYINRVKEVSPKNILEKIKGLNNPLIGVGHGTNAGFGKALFGSETVIVIPEKKLAGAGFHEMGHALNYNFSKAGKLLQKMRLPGMLAAAAIVAFGCFTKKSKAQDGKELTTGQKVKNGIRDNAGKLAFLAVTPMLIEEAMATIKGQKIANKLLDKNLAKTILKGNGVAYLTYVATAAGLALAAWAGVKIKDKLVAKKNS
jgi:hypothetical protein